MANRVLIQIFPIISFSRVKAKLMYALYGRAEIHVPEKAGYGYTNAHISPPQIVYQKIIFSPVSMDLLAAKPNLSVFIASEYGERILEPSPDLIASIKVRSSVTP